MVKDYINKYFRFTIADLRFKNLRSKIIFNRVNSLYWKSLVSNPALTGLKSSV